MKKVVLIVTGTILAFVLGIGALLYLGYRGISSRPPTRVERTMMLSAYLFKDYGFTNLQRSICETRTAKLNLDGTIELEYEYDSSLGSDSNFLFISSDVNLERSEKDARQSFRLGIEAYKIGLKIGNARAEERPALFTLGDEHYSSVVFVNDDPWGNMVVVRHGRIIHSLILMGLYFDEPGYLDEFFYPALENSDPAKFGNR